MKKVQITILALFGVGVFACANEIPSNQIPSVVKNALMSKYPDATDIEWEMKKQLYEVEFEIGEADYDAWIDSTGTILKVVKDISLTEIPVAIQKSIALEFKQQTIDDAEEILIKENKYYRIELEGALGDHKVVYNSDGKLENSAVLFKYN